MWQRSCPMEGLTSVLWQCLADVGRCCLNFSYIELLNVSADVIADICASGVLWLKSVCWFDWHVDSLFHFRVPFSTNYSTAGVILLMWASVPRRDGSLMFSFNIFALLLEFEIRIEYGISDPENISLITGCFRCERANVLDQTHCIGCIESSLG